VLLPDELRASAAWARALTRAKVLEPAECARIEEGLEAIGAELAANIGAIEASRAEDVHTLVENELERRVGALARKLHTGRSRNDQVATDLKLHLRRRVPLLEEARLELVRALLGLAERSVEIVLPGYTHMQRAQPISAAHHALAYVEMLARDGERFRDALARCDSCPLGSAALAGTAWPIDREELARDLRFERGATHNSLDAVSDRDHVLELAFASSLAMVHLSRLAEDWIFFASQEAGFLELSDAVTTGSSLMPQKKNPDALELVRGKAGRVIGALTALLVTVKGLPLAYDKDLQEDKRALFDALDTTEACLRVTALVAREARYDGERSRAAASRGFLDATDLADLLVRRGVPFRDAHERVGRAVREAQAAGVELAGLPAERRRALFPELSGELSAELALERQLERRGTLGGTAPARVREEIARWNAHLRSSS
jgi:argininosuccinate lyase